MLSFGVGLGVAILTACSGAAPGSFTDGDAAAPSPTTTTTGTTTAPSSTADAAPPKNVDAAPPIDKTPRFDLTLDGSPITITTVNVKVEAASSSDPARVWVSGQYQQDFGEGFTSTATFTVEIATTESGTSACDASKRFATYLYEDQPGSITEGATSLQGGSCTMSVLANLADGFSSGSATGVLGGTTTKSFALTWGQPIPKS